MEERCSGCGRKAQDSCTLGKTPWTKKQGKWDGSRFFLISFNWPYLAIKQKARQKGTKGKNKILTKRSGVCSSCADCAMMHWFTVHRFDWFHGAVRWRCSPVHVVTGPKVGTDRISVAVCVKTFPYTSSLLISRFRLNNASPGAFGRFGSKFHFYSI